MGETWLTDVKGVPVWPVMLGFLWSVPVWGGQESVAGPPPLPDPLSLEQALALADETHPDLEMAQARRDRASAEVLAAESLTGFKLNFDLVPQAADLSRDKSIAFVDDSYAQLSLTRRLYDFGRSSSLERSARARVQSRSLDYLDVRQRRRLEIMARFFDVLLADRRYAVDNEEMAYRYVIFDKGRERHRLGMISDVELLSLESRYQEALIARTRSQLRQSSTRAQLAIVLNRPGDLPARLVEPELKAVPHAIPDYDMLLKEVLAANPRLQAMRHEVRAAEERLAAERALRRPVLSGEIKGTAWKREVGSRTSGNIGLSLRVPLYQGQADRAAIARAAAALRERKAILDKAELGLRQTLLDLLQELESLKIQRQAAQIRLDARDLELDRRRALYELERDTTLGNAMVRVTEAHWQAAKVDYEAALTWARVEALRKRLINDNTVGDKP